MRSKLFVPGSRPELYSKALDTSADAISIDLEDSVAEGRKEEARKCVSEFLRSSTALATSKTIIVRINAIDSPYFEDDLIAVVQSSLGMLNLPKVEGADEIRRAAAILEQFEKKRGLDKPVRILANIESASSLHRAAEIGSAHPRIAGLQLGLHDLFGPLGIDRADLASVHAAMFALRIAAAEADVFALDGAFADIDNVAGFRAEADMAHRLGYWGKSCIHPSQVAIANEAFVPSNEDIAFAQRVLIASRSEEYNGIGAFVVDGKMIDLPAIRRAEVLVAKGQHRSNSSR